MNVPETYSVKIEKMTLEHLDEVMEIEKLSYTTPWSREAFVTEVQDNDFAKYFVALQHSVVIGYAGMWIILDESHVTTIAVHPDFRKQGLGRLLMTTLMKEAIVLGADRITLEVRPSNTSARSLYNSLGFKPVGVRKGYYTDNNEDAIIMWKSLRS
ncbi:MAG: [ribosomal protein S18]-alanine N-acetyltransferase [Clostridia bacterium]|nr:ribosomal-protein-alanine N-acetyltransferase [Clostridiales bacterium]MDK2984791.1 [ribosomal protein S18]-alanine N-acetyltransferase [Clostridia bacterium]